jgi:hypothetical protein
MLRSGQVEMEPEVIVSFVRGAMFGEIHKPTGYGARNRVSSRVIARGDRIDGDAAQAQKLADELNRDLSPGTR